MNTPRNRQLDILTHRLDRAANIVPTIQAHLDEQRSLVTVLAAASTDTSHGSGVSDPTGRTVEHLAHIDYRNGCIIDAIATINVAINVLDDACRDALATRAPASINDTPTTGDKPRCQGDGAPAGAVCEQIPIERTDRHTGSRVDDQRCLDCGPRWDDAQEARRVDAHRKRVQRLGSGRSSQVDGWN